ncbi:MULTISPECIES: MFS transporter [unclassified Moorena]|uniref:MFS transporter n=1 Tax=unclassified Moorena TaxID=2683338 RepID=UPI0025E47BB4|nr:MULTISPECIES: MFS transporter [unclassified Moorena]
MRYFILIWLGQLVSLIGSGLTRFALGVWVYQSTQSVTLFTLITLCNTLPLIVITPLAGSLVDRWPRRWVMILSDSGNCICTLGIAILLVNNSLSIYYVYLLTAINCVLNTFQWPAYAAATTLLVPHDQLSRASGMTQVAEAIGQLFCPVLAAVLLVSIGLQGIIAIDLITFSFALLTLLLVRFPEPKNVDLSLNISIKALLG